MKINKAIKKLIIFFIIAMVILILNHKFKWSKYLGDIENLSFLREMVNNNYLLSIFLYIILTIVGCVVLALPGVTFAIVAGLLFGSFVGIIVCIVATTLGAMLSFLVGRFFLKDAIRPMLEKNRLLRNLLFNEDGKSDLLLLMITRMVPIFPYNLQNFAYGITNIDFWKYSIFTFIFMLPGVSFFTIGAAGFTAGENRWKYFVIAGILAIAVTITGIIVQKKFIPSKKKIK